MAQGKNGVHGTSRARMADKVSEPLAAGADPFSRHSRKHRTTIPRTRAATDIPVSSARAVSRIQSRIVSRMVVGTNSGGG